MPNPRSDPHVRHQDHDSQLMKKNIFGLLIVVLGTLLTGLTLRWQLAGVSNVHLASLDWRRAHSHLGFYGVLFPISWLCLTGSQLWTPGHRMKLTYFCLVLAAGLSFLLQGYGLYSIAASTGILCVWLIFAWKNWRPQRLFSKTWDASISTSIFISALLILSVAVLTRSRPDLAAQFARAFLTLLLFGAFVPAMLGLFGSSPPLAILWMISTISAALFLTKIGTHPLLGAGLVFISFTFLRSVLQSEIKDLRLKLMWIVFAVGLGLTGVGWLPGSYSQAIAGIHFLVLGPLLMTFALLRLKLRIRSGLRLLYETSLVLMVLGISVQEYSSYPLARFIAWTATGLVVSLLLILGTSHFETAA